MVEKYLKTSITLLFFLFSLLGNKAHANSPSLVEIFCVEWLHLAEQGEVLGSGGEVWEQFSDRLEKRESILAKGDPLIEKYASDFQSCGITYAPYFEKAAFILGGKNLVSESLSDLKENTNRDRRVSGVKIVEGATERFVVGDIVVVLAPQDGGNLESDGALEVRESEYSELWNSFLVNLRETLVSRNASRSPAN